MKIERIKLRQNPSNRSDYNCFTKLSTRWNDNDIYGHLNNVIYYELFDTAVNNCNGDLNCAGFMVHKPSKSLCFFKTENDAINWDDKNEQNNRLNADTTRDVYTRM